MDSQLQTDNEREVKFLSALSEKLRTLIYRATPAAKRRRRGMVRALRRAARKPFKKVLGV